MKNNNKKTCWACKRILIRESRSGLCPACINKIGSVTATAGIALSSLAVWRVHNNMNEQDTD